MAKEQISLSLLEKLAESPDGASPASSNPQEPRGVSPDVFLERLKFDLERLLNTRVVWPTQAIPPSKDSPSTDRTLDDYKHVVSSVLYCGLPDPAGRLLSADDARLLTRRIYNAIVRFEPRINPSTLSVEVQESSASGEADFTLAPLRFVVRGEVSLFSPARPVTFCLESEPVSENLKVEWTQDS